MLKLGIGITTFNRKSILKETILNTRSMTSHLFCALVVADDGSSDETAEMLASMGVACVRGENMGVAWNKNRALYLLNARLHCDVTILLEDDAFPSQPGWERHWIEAALAFGHSNIALDSHQQFFVSGSGTVEDPILSSMVTAQCSVFSAQSLERSGYFDPRFRGFGHEHVEHSARLVRHGFGGTEDKGNMTWWLIRSPISLARSVSTGTAELADRNLEIAREIMGDQTYRAPWRSDSEMRQFLGEIDDVVVPSSGFDLRPVATPPPEPQPLWKRLFSRTAR